MQIRFLTDIDGPIGQYAAGDVIDVREQVADAWYQAGIAEPANKEEDVTDKESAEVATAPEHETAVRPSPRGRQTKPAETTAPPSETQSPPPDDSGTAAPAETKAE